MYSTKTEQQEIDQLKAKGFWLLAQDYARQWRQTIVIIKTPDGRYYGVPETPWLNAEGDIEGIPEYKFVTIVEQPTVDVNSRTSSF